MCTLRNYGNIFKSLEKFCAIKYDTGLENIIEDLAIIENTSGALRFLAKLGLKFDAIKPEEIDEEKLKEITIEMNQKVEEETFFEWINSKTPEQQRAMKNWITMQEQARDKQQL